MLSISSDPEHRGGYLLEAEAVLPCSLDQVFPFFADAMNLERLTPSWLNFEVLTPPPIEMYAGQTIDYRLKLHHVPVRWRTEIAEWNPPHSFADHQLRGPYRYWRHQHFFEQTPDGTRCRDVVHYGVPGGALVHRLLVRRDVEAIFRYRQQVMRELFGREVAAQSA